MNVPGLHGAVRWLWHGDGPGAMLARVAASPAAGLWAAAMAGRTAAYAAGLRRAWHPGVPTIAIGNLTVGGTGKTPLASWIADWCLERGVVPGVVLRGYRGGDEVLVHRERTPRAVVTAHPDRRRAAAEAVSGGAQLVLLDDAFQRVDIARDLNVVVLAAEETGRPRWRLPAGPWREGLRALRRADLVVVLRKEAPPEVAARLADALGKRTRAPVAIGRLAPEAWVGVLSGERRLPPWPAGRRVVAACGIGRPAGFFAQLRSAGAVVDPVAWPDHHIYSAAEARALAARAGAMGTVVVTQKDAVKLRPLWPSGTPEPVMALLELTWEAGADGVTRALEAVTSHLTPRPEP